LTPPIRVVRFVLAAMLCLPAIGLGGAAAATATTPIAGAQLAGTEQLDFAYELASNATVSKLELYLAVGKVAPGTATKPPSSTPAFHCAQCATSEMLRFPHLNHDFRTYSASLYAYQSGKVVQRVTVSAKIERSIAYLDGRQLPSWSYAGSLAVDAAGDVHEVGPFNSDGPNGPSHYVTKLAASKTFTYRPIHNSSRGLGSGFDTSGILSQYVATAANGRSTDLVVETCGRVRVAKVAANSITPPRLTASSNAVDEHLCDSGDGELNGVATTAHGEVALLFGDDPAHPRGGFPSVYIGRAGGHFTKTTLPQSTIFMEGLTIASDPGSGQMYVAGVNNDESSAPELDVWSLAKSGRSWTDPTTIDILRTETLPAGMVQLDSLSSMTAAAGQVWVGLSRGPRSSTHPDSSAGVFVIHRSMTGRWSTATRLPNTSLGAYDIQLAAMPQLHRSRGAVHLWALNDRLAGVSPAFAGSGLRLREHTSTGWGRPTRVSHEFDDADASLVLSGSGQPHFVYTRLGEEPQSGGSTSETS
jgi:hypothetical protein